MIRNDVQEHRCDSTQRRVEAGNADLHGRQMVRVRVDAPMQANASREFRRQVVADGAFDEIPQHAAGNEAVAGMRQQAVRQKVHAAGSSI